MVNFYKWIYKDGSSITLQHDEVLDGKWKFGDIETISYKINSNNPWYE